MKAPLPPDEPLRLRTLQEYHILDTLPEQTYDDLTFLASLICGTPTALLTIVDEDRQWFKSRLGFDMSQTPRDQAFCSHAILTPDLMLIPNTTEDERFADNPLVVSGPAIRFYAGAPLVTAEGAALGTLCVIDKKPRELTAEQQEALRALGRQAVAQLEMRRLLSDMATLLASHVEDEQPEQQHAEEEHAEEEQPPLS